MYFVLRVLTCRSATNIYQQSLHALALPPSGSMHVLTTSDATCGAQLATCSDSVYHKINTLRVLTRKRLLMEVERRGREGTRWSRGADHSHSHTRHTMQLHHSKQMRDFGSHCANGVMRKHFLVVF